MNQEQLPEILDLNEETHLDCEYCTELAGADVWHPWTEFEEGNVGRKRVNWCKAQWDEYENTVDPFAPGYWPRELEQI